MVAIIEVITNFNDIKKLRNVGFALQFALFKTKHVPVENNNIENDSLDSQVDISM